MEKKHFVKIVTSLVTLNPISMNISSQGRMIVLHCSCKETLKTKSNFYKVVISLQSTGTVEHFYLFKMKLVATCLETRTTYSKKEPHCDQPRTCSIFMVGCIKSIFFN